LFLFQLAIFLKIFVETTSYVVVDETCCQIAAGSRRESFVVPDNPCFDFLVLLVMSWNWYFSPHKGSCTSL
jgi:hypothetical protein